MTSSDIVMYFVFCSAMLWCKIFDSHFYSENIRSMHFTSPSKDLIRQTFSFDEQNLTDCNYHINVCLTYNCLLEFDFQNKYYIFLKRIAIMLVNTTVFSKLSISTISISYFVLYFYLHHYIRFKSCLTFTYNVPWW